MRPTGALGPRKESSSIYYTGWIEWAGWLADDFLPSPSSTFLYLPLPSSFLPYLTLSKANNIYVSLQSFFFFFFSVCECVCVFFFSFSLFFLYQNIWQIQEIVWLLGVASSGQQPCHCHADRLWWWFYDSHCIDFRYRLDMWKRVRIGNKNRNVPRWNDP